MDSANKTVLVHSDVASTMATCAKVVAECGWKVKKSDSYGIQASNGMSLTSYGETITILASVSGENTILKVNSKSVFALVDWGKNQCNIDKFISGLSRYVAIQ